MDEAQEDMSMGSGTVIPNSSNMEAAHDIFPTWEWSRTSKLPVINSEVPRNALLAEGLRVMKI